MRTVQEGWKAGCTMLLRPREEAEGWSSVDWQREHGLGATGLLRIRAGPPGQGLLTQSSKCLMWKELRVLETESCKVSWPNFSSLQPRGLWPH